jgi:hypothetical protein
MALRWAADELVVLGPLAQEPTLALVGSVGVDVIVSPGSVSSWTTVGGCHGQCLALRTAPTFGLGVGTAMGEGLRSLEQHVLLTHGRPDAAVTTRPAQWNSAL